MLSPACALTQVLCLLLLKCLAVATELDSFLLLIRLAEHSAGLPGDCWQLLRVCPTQGARLKSLGAKAWCKVSCV